MYLIVKQLKLLCYYNVIYYRRLLLIFLSIVDTTDISRLHVYSYKRSFTSKFLVRYSILYFSNLSYRLFYHSHIMDFNLLVSGLLRLLLAC